MNNDSEFRLCPWCSHCQRTDMRALAGYQALSCAAPDSDWLNPDECLYYDPLPPPPIAPTERDASAT